MLLGEIKQYYLNYIFYNLGLVVMFVGIFYSFSDSNTSTGIVMLFGLITWQLCVSSVSYFTNVMQDEALMGTLEQIFMTRTSIFKLLSAKVFVTSLFDITKASLLFTICLFLFGIQNSLFSFGTRSFIAIPVIFIAVSGFYALGLFFAGLALFYKRIDSIIQIISYVLLFFTNITIAIDQLSPPMRVISNFIPITWVTMLLEYILYENHSIGVSLGYLLLRFAITIVLFVFVGLVGFIVSLKRAKDLGKLGHY